METINTMELSQFIERTRNLVFFCSIILFSIIVVIKMALKRKGICDYVLRNLNYYVVFYCFSIPMVKYIIYELFEIDIYTSIVEISNYEMFLVYLLAIACVYKAVFNVLCFFVNMSYNFISLLWKIYYQMKKSKEEKIESEDNE